MRPHREFWLWLAAAMLLIGAAATGVASAFYAKRQYFDFWTSPEMAVAYSCAGLAVLFFYFAFSGKPFPPWADRYARPTGFPDLEVEVTKSGGATVPHAVMPSVPVKVAFYGVRIVNHEPERTAVITMRLFQDAQFDDDGPPDVVCGVFGGDHPEVHQRRLNLLQMPLNIRPGASISGDLIFELNDWESKSTQTPTRLELEDHLSGAKISMGAHLGTYGAR